MNKLEGKTILVVDDEKALCDIMADEFELAGAKVIKAHSGNEAFEIIKSQSVDAILSDINMPNGTGIDLIKRLHTDVANHPMILFMTGYSEHTHAEAYNLGAKAIFPKPCDLDEVVDKNDGVMIRFLLDNGYSVNHKNSLGRTIFHDVAIFGNEKVFQILMNSLS
jgi:CheY-like chemotaxis protein